MTKPYDAERVEARDMASLAVEQFNYLEALVSALANRLDALDHEDRTIGNTKRLALLGRSHAEQWACTFMDEVNG